MLELTVVDLELRLKLTLKIRVYLRLILCFLCWRELPREAIRRGVGLHSVGSSVGSSNSGSVGGTGSNHGRDLLRELSCQPELVGADGSVMMFLMSHVARILVRFLMDVMLGLLGLRVLQGP